MAILLINTFKTKEQKVLLKKVRLALKNLCGHGHSREGSYLTAPRKLRLDRDFLKENYKEIWKHCTIRFDPQEKGASIRGKKDIHIGPFFLQPRFTVMDVEKIILHEFLHAALDISMEDAHHGLIYQVIKENIKYPGPANVGTCGI